jgi:predicted nucleic acid-binding protein
MMLLIDTDVFLRAFRDSNFLELIKPFNPTVCTVVNIEAIQGSKSKAEIKRLEKFIQLNFFRVSNTREDLKRALELVRRYSSSSGILLGDALIGATAINRSLPLFTFNQKHFRYPEIKPLVFQP